MEMMNLRAWFDHEKNDLKNDFYAYPKRKILLLTLGVFLLLGTLFRLWLLVSYKTISSWDDWLISQARSFQTPFLDKFFSFLTIFGSGYFMIVAFLILALFLFRKRRKKAAVTVFFTLIGSGFLVFLFKGMFGRPRPFGCFSGSDCFSFPSGHTTLSFYFYGILFYLMLRFTRVSRITFWLLGLGLLFLIILVAFSRIYLGFHFPTDVVSGFLLGGIFLLIAAILIDFFYQ